MRRPRLSAIGALAGAAACAFGVSAAWCTEPQALSRHAFERLEARPMECPASARSAWDDGQTADCAALEASFARFEKTWRRFVKEQDRFEMVAVNRWRDQGPRWKTRAYRVDNEPVQVMFSESNRGLMLIYGVPTPMCADASAEERGLPFAGTNGISMPELGPAKIQLSAPGDTRGPLADVTVTLKIKVDKTGKPTVLCVLDVQPEGYEVEDSAVFTVEKWRYRPALLDGEPVDVAMTITFDW